MQLIYTYGFTIYIFSNEIAFITYLKDSTWTNALRTYICKYTCQASLSSKSVWKHNSVLNNNSLPSSKSFLSLENVWKYISYLNNDSRFRNRQLWMQPCHTVCLDVCMLFRIHFLINKLAFIISLARFSKWCYSWHFNKSGRGIFESAIHTRYWNRNDVFGGSVKGGTFVTIKIILKLLLI